VTEQETRKVRGKTERDITAVQSLLAMSQWSPPNPEHSILPTSDPLFSVLDPIQPSNIQFNSEKVQNLLFFYSLYIFDELPVYVLIRMPSFIRH
jgi:hypothetical protein